MEKKLVARLISTVYLSLEIKKTGLNEVINFGERIVFLKDIHSKKAVLESIKRLVQEHESFLFCLVWEKDVYYFDKDGSFKSGTMKPYSDLSNIGYNVIFD